VKPRHPSFPERIVKALLPLLVLGTLSAPAQAEPRQLLGYAGMLGEWELTATVTEQTLRWAREFSGPLTMTHVGICTRDGPEERTGEIRIQISGLTSRLEATLLLDGAECTYSAGASEPYSGMMACRDRETVPLKLWLK
jgi:hypothetical protein